MTGFHDTAFVFSHRPSVAGKRSQIGMPCDLLVHGTEDGKHGRRRVSSLDGSFHPGWFLDGSLPGWFCPFPSQCSLPRARAGGGLGRTEFGVSACRGPWADPRVYRVGPTDHTELSCPRCGLRRLALKPEPRKEESDAQGWRGLGAMESGATPEKPNYPKVLQERVRGGLRRQGSDSSPRVAHPQWARPGLGAHP